MAERWTHIVEDHPELATMEALVLRAVSAPERVYVGRRGELSAVVEHEPGKWLIAVYREQGSDGFLITAFLTRRTRYYLRRTQVWP